MEDLRKKLDEIDSQLSRLFDERMSVAADIARYKRCRSLPIEDKEREAAILARYDEHSHAFREMMEKVILLSKREQARHLNLYLVGMPDSGKTRFGKLLAPMLERSLADHNESYVENNRRNLRFARRAHFQALRASMPFDRRKGGRPRRSNRRRRAYILRQHSTHA